jgi:hypothetical protein
MKTEGGAPSNEPSGAVKGESKPQICSICGIQLSSKDEFCPACMLRKVLEEKIESGESFSEHSVKPRSVWLQWALKLLEFGIGSPFRSRAGNYR